MSRLAESLAPHQYSFGGNTFHVKRDGARLSHQLEKVRALLADGQWRTLREISDSVGAPEASVSARYRDLVRLRFNMEKKNDGGGRWLYRMKP